MRADRPTLSVITATWNAAALLPRLVASLAAQHDQDFEWVVADGGSTDETVLIVQQAANRLKRVVLDSRPDFGIYDALNRAVRMSSGDYYVVIGADDEFFPDAVRNFKVACRTSGADMVTARITIAGSADVGVRSPAWEWLYGPFAHVTSHAVGLAIRRSLHQRFGEYSRKYPIAADRLFILQVVHGGARISVQDFVAGHFSGQGLSGTDTIGTLLEGFRIQVRTGQGFWLQWILLLIRIVKNHGRIRRRHDVDVRMRVAE